MTAHSSAVIVSGASSGIGAAIARSAARSRMVFVGFNQGAERATEIVRGIIANGGEAMAIRLPLTDADGLNAGLDAIAAVGRKVDALVLSANPPPIVISFLKATGKQFNDQAAATIIGNHQLLSQVWRRFFRPRAGGHVIAILSAAAGASPTPHLAPYVVAKAGVKALLRAAAAELGQAGLAISTIAPGFTETPMLASFDPRLLAAQRKAHGGFLKADDVAATVCDALDTPPVPGKLHILDLPKAPSS